MKKVKNMFKKILATAAVVLGTVAPAFANESVEVVDVNNTTAIEMSTEEEIAVAQVRAEMTLTEWKAFVAENNWDNVQLVGKDGEYMIFEAYRCGKKVADVIFKELVEQPEVEQPEVEQDVNYDDQISTLPEFDYVVEEEEVNYDDLVTTLPSDELVETEESVDQDEKPEEEVNYDDLVTTLPSDELVETEETVDQDEKPEEEVNYDDLVTTLPSDELVETEETVLDGTANDNMMVTPEVEVEEVVVEEEKTETTKKPVNNTVKTEESNYSPIANDLMLNPMTGDNEDVVIYLALITIASLGLFFLNKKENN